MENLKLPYFGLMNCTSLCGETGTMTGKAHTEQSENKHKYYNSQRARNPQVQGFHNELKENDENAENINKVPLITPA